MSDYGKGKHDSKLGLFGGRVQKYTDPLSWIFGDKYTNFISHDLPREVNHGLSTVMKPFEKVDKKINPVRKISGVDKGMDEVAEHPGDALAAVAGAIFGGGALLGGAGGGAAGGAGAGSAGASGGASGLSFAGGTTGAPALGAGTSTGLATGVDMAGTGVGSTGAGVGSSGAGGLLTMDNASKGLGLAQQSGLLDQQQQQPMQAGQVGRQGPDFSGLLAASGQLDAQRLAEEEKRKQQQQVIVQGLLGGAYGR